MNNRKKMVALLLVLMLVIGCAVGGTLAWLIANSNQVVNTFTVGNIELALIEESQETKYNVVPGTKQTKDPYVQVAANSESCWVFVKITEANNDTGETTEGAPQKYVQWEINSAWKAVDGATGVYYQLHTEIDTPTNYPILNNDEVTYSSKLTKDMLKNASNPTLTFQAYAIQSEALKTSNGTEISTTGENVGSAAEAAWAVLNPAPAEP